MQDIQNQSITELAELLRKREISSVELTKFYLDRIDKHQEHLNCYITLCHDSAISQAENADKSIATNEGHLLTGIPFAHKDIFCTKGTRTTCGSKMLENFISPYDATVTEKLFSQGAVMLGKTNMDEFAMGSSNEHSYFGPCKNPYNFEMSPGGSSGGSASAVASNLAVYSTGTDTGGSIRQPAAFCNLVGLKPTYGRVSRYGMIAFASSFDQAGPLTSCVEDAAIVLDAMTGHCPHDSTSSKAGPTQAHAGLKESLPKGFKIALVKQFYERLSASLQKKFDAIVKMIQDLGGVIEFIDMPMIDAMIPSYYIIAPAEASSNLARYDGVRYGHRSSTYSNLEEMYTNSRTEGFGDEVKRRILTGTYVLSSGYYDAYYNKAQKIRTLIKEHFDNLFQTYQFVLTPTTLEPAFKLKSHDHDPTAMYYSDLCTVSANLAGLPAVSLPAIEHDNLPFGIQFIAGRFKEEELLRLSYALEKLYSPQVQHLNKSEAVL